eukprot:gene19020-22740_t
MFLKHVLIPLVLLGESARAELCADSSCPDAYAVSNKAPWGDYVCGIGLTVGNHATFGESPNVTLCRSHDGDGLADFVFHHSHHSHKRAVEVKGHFEDISRVPLIVIWPSATSPPDLAGWTEAQLQLRGTAPSSPQALMISHVPRRPPGYPDECHLWYSWGDVTTWVLMRQRWVWGHLPTSAVGEPPAATPCSAKFDCPSEYAIDHGSTFGDYLCGITTEWGYEQPNGEYLPPPLCSLEDCAAGHAPSGAWLAQLAGNFRVWKPEVVIWRSGSQKPDGAKKDQMKLTLGSSTSKSIKVTCPAQAPPPAALGIAGWMRSLVVVEDRALREQALELVDVADPEMVVGVPARPSGWPEVGHIWYNFGVVFEDWVYSKQKEGHFDCPSDYATAHMSAAGDVLCGMTDKWGYQQKDASYLNPPLCEADVFVSGSTTGYDWLYQKEFDCPSKEALKHEDPNSPKGSPYYICGITTKYGYETERGAHLPPPLCELAGCITQVMSPGAGAWVAQVVGSFSGNVGGALPLIVIWNSSTTGPTGDTFATAMLGLWDFSQNSTSSSLKSYTYAFYEESTHHLTLYPAGTTATVGQPQSVMPDLPTMDAFGVATKMSDHNYAYGYHIAAAALLALAEKADMGQPGDDKDWHTRSKYGPAVDMLIQDLAYVAELHPGREVDWWVDRSNFKFARLEYMDTWTGLAFTDAFAQESGAEPNTDTQFSLNDLMYMLISGTQFPQAQSSSTGPAGSSMYTMLNDPYGSGQGGYYTAKMLHQLHGLRQPAKKPEWYPAGSGEHFELRDKETMESQLMASLKDLFTLFWEKEPGDTLVGADGATQVNKIPPKPKGWGMTSYIWCSWGDTASWWLLQEWVWPSDRPTHFRSLPVGGADWAGAGAAYVQLERVAPSLHGTHIPAGAEYVDIVNPGTAVYGTYGVNEETNPAGGAARSHSWASPMTFSNASSQAKYWTARGEAAKVLRPKPVFADPVTFLYSTQPVNGDGGYSYHNYNWLLQAPNDPGAFHPESLYGAGFHVGLPAGTTKSGVLFSTGTSQSQYVFGTRASHDGAPVDLGQDTAGVFRDAFVVYPEEPRDKGIAHVAEWLPDNPETRSQGDTDLVIRAADPARPTAVYMEVAIAQGSPFAQFESAGSMSIVVGAVFPGALATGFKTPLEPAVLLGVNGPASAPFKVNVEGDLGGVIMYQILYQQGDVLLWVCADVAGDALLRVCTDVAGDALLWVCADVAGDALLWIGKDNENLMDTRDMTISVWASVAVMWEAGTFQPAGLLPLLAAPDRDAGARYFSLIPQHTDLPARFVVTPLPNQMANRAAGTNGMPGFDATAARAWAEALAPYAFNYHTGAGKVEFYVGKNPDGGVEPPNEVHTVWTPALTRRGPAMATANGAPLTVSLLQPLHYSTKFNDGRGGKMPLNVDADFTDATSPFLSFAGDTLSAQTNKYWIPRGGILSQAPLLPSGTVAGTFLSLSDPSWSLEIAIWRSATQAPVGSLGAMRIGDTTTSTLFSLKIMSVPDRPPGWPETCYLWYRWSASGPWVYMKQEWLWPGGPTPPATKPPTAHTKPPTTAPTAHTKPPTTAPTAHTKPPTMAPTTPNTKPPTAHTKPP